MALALLNPVGPALDGGAPRDELPQTMRNVIRIRHHHHHHAAPSGGGVEACA